MSNCQPVSRYSVIYSSDYKGQFTFLITLHQELSSYFFLFHAQWNVVVVILTEFLLTTAVTVFASWCYLFFLSSFVICSFFNSAQTLVCHVWVQCKTAKALVTLFLPWNTMHVPWNTMHVTCSSCIAQNKG